MDLELLRLAQRLLSPPASILLLPLIGLLLLRFCRAAGRAFIVAGFLLLYALSISPVASALIAPLERDFRPVNVTRVKADIIVVLGGGANDRSWLGLEPQPSEGSLQRVVAAIKLYRALHLPILITGGAGDTERPQLSDADSMVRAALELGVPRKDLILDNRSPTTLASAENVKRICGGKRIILVTSAFHLKRSLAMFAARGMDCIPEPSGYLGGEPTGWPNAALPGMDYLGISTRALSEYESYLWYRINGEL